MRTRGKRGWETVEIVCVAIVVIAALGLVAWFVLHHGGGVFNQG